MKTENVGIERAPAGLSWAMRKFWRDVVGEFELEPHQLHILRQGCFSYDRAMQAKKTIDADGLTYDDRFGCPHPRPEIQIEKQSREQFLRHIKSLNLDLEQIEPVGRPPGG